MNQHDLKIIIDAQNQSRDALADFSRKLNEQVRPALQIQKQLDDLCKKMVPIPPTISRELSLLDSAVRTSSDLYNRALLDAQTPLKQATKDALEALDHFEKKFRIPAIYELPQLANNLIHSELFNAFTIHQKQLDSLISAMAQIQTPWLNSIDELGSLAGFAKLQHLGQGINNLPPFGIELTKELRQSLGDWRSIMDFPIDIIENPESRISYYHSLGFDSKLTLFPSSAFEQGLMIAGLDSTIPQDYHTELEHEEEGVERDSYGYNILLRFERHIRNFIVKKMEEVVGPRWIRQRVSGEMSRNWRERQETAQMNGEAECRLIDYADFTDYAKIIERRDNWNDIFKPYFGRHEDMRESFQRLYPIRLCTMHARFITSDDQLLLLSETRRILRAIGVID